METLLANWQALFVVALIVIALALFVTEALPAEITALGILAALAVSRILTPREAFSGFSNDATLTVLMMFILSAAVLQSGLIDWLGDRLGVLMGRSLMRQVLAIGLLVGPISAFINNTAAVAVMIPLILQIASKAQQSPSKLLIPLSFAAMLGGTVTLIGTSTNLLGSVIREEAGLGAFGMFEFSMAGLMIFAVGMVYIVVATPVLLPGRIQPRPQDEMYHSRPFVLEAVVPAKSVLIGRPIGEANLARRYNIAVVQIRRGDAILNPDAGGLHYKEGDRLFLGSTRASLQRLVDTGIVEVISGASNEPVDHHLYAELFVHSHSTAQGRRLGDLEFWEDHDVQPIALHNRLDLHRGHISERVLQAGDVVLVSGTEGSLVDLTGGDDFRVQGGPETPLRRPHKTPLVLLILGLVVGVAALGILPIVVTSTAGVVLMIATGALRLQEMYRSIHWNVIFLLAGIIPLGTAMEVTGVAAMIGHAFALSSPYMPGVALLGLFYLVTTILTNVISNNAAVVLTAPIGMEIAAELGYNPTSFILASMFAASTSFVTPIGYQTNLMVMAPGGYRYVDFLRFGMPLNLLLVVATPIIINIFWPVL